MLDHYAKDLPHLGSRVSEVTAKLSILENLDKPQSYSGESALGRMAYFKRQAAVNRCRTGGSLYMRHFQFKGLCTKLPHVQAGEGSEKGSLPMNQQPTSTLLGAT